MKLPKEIVNGSLIFLGIGIYFLLMNVLGLADLFYLRVLNVFFIFYGVNRTMQMNLHEGETNFVSNAVSAMATSVVGVSMSVFGLLVYSYARGEMHMLSLYPRLLCLEETLQYQLTASAYYLRGLHLQLLSL